MEQTIRNYPIWNCSMWNSSTWNYYSVKLGLNMRPWELLLRNVNVLHSVLEKAEPELSLLELDTKRLFILCMVDANAFPADLARVLSMPKPSMTFLIKKLEESGYLRRQWGKGDFG